MPDRAPFAWYGSFGGAAQLRMSGLGTQRRPSPHTYCVEFSIQCASGFAVFFFGIFLGGIELFTLGALRSSAQQGRALRKGGLLEIHLSKLLLDEVSVGPPDHASPPGDLWGVAGRAFAAGTTAQGVQMSNSLFSPLMGELSHYLHFMSGFLRVCCGLQPLSCSRSKGVRLSIGGCNGVIHPKTCPGPGYGYHRR